MKKRLSLILLAICLIFAMTTVVSAAEVELLNEPDPLLWRNYFITNLKTGQGYNFECEIPEDGALVLIFYSPDCGNSQALFASLNQCSWVDNPNIVISASNINRRATAEWALGMVQEKALNVYDYIDVTYGRSSAMGNDYAYAAGVDFSTYPLVVVVTQSESGRMIRYADDAQTSAAPIYDVLCAVSPSFVDYEAKKAAGEVDSHIHDYSDWQYTQEPTCTEDGEEARICECGAKFARAAQALGHSSDAGTITKEPTQTEKGQVGFVCSRCGENHTVEIPALADAASHSGDLNTEKPTRKALHDAWTGISDTENYFAEEPAVSAPYATGRLTDELLESGLDYLSFVRLAANLPDVQLSDELNDNAQYGAVVLAALDMGLSHYPQWPADMDQDFYEQGYDATSSSNLHMRYGFGGNPLHYAVKGFMDDPGETNMLALGHRRWLLNPVLQNVGFGYAKAESESEYITTKVFDQSGSGIEYDFISWPASGNFPVNVFNFDAAWSISLNPRKYMDPELDYVQVTMTRESDGRTWLFNSSTGEPKAPDTYHLTVNTDNYGGSSCIIFAPGSESNGDYRGDYLITVSGIYTLDGEPASLCYEVSFFDAEDECLEHSYTTENIPASCENPGHTLYTCTICGDSYKVNTAPQIDHQFTTKTVEATCEWGGYTESVCGMCGLNRKTDFTDPLEHNFEVVGQVAPTCEEKGYTQTKCSRCGSERSENFVNALEHNYVDGVCSNCGRNVDESNQPTEPEVDGDVLIISDEYRVSNQIIDSDVYITATGVAVFENVVVNGDVYCHGQLTAFDLVADYIYGYAFGSMYVCDAYDGTHGFITGSLSCYDLIIADDALDYAFETWGDGTDTPTEPTEPEETKPSEPEETKPTEPEETKPTEPEETVPMENPFTDIGENDKVKPYYYEPVLWAVSRGITTGMTETTFAPESSCTRGQIVTFIWRAAGKPEPSSDQNPFKDVKPSDYFYKAVLWAVENGITNGLSANSFGPNQSCTRAQVCTFLWRAQGKPAPQSSSSPFSDVTGDYYYDAVLWAVENGVTNGMGGGKFAPGATCTRGQIVTFLYRAIA